MVSPINMIGNAANFAMNEASSAQTQINHARRTGASMVQEQLNTELQLIMIEHKGLEGRGEAVTNRSKDTMDKAGELLRQAAQPN